MQGERLGLAETRCFEQLGVGRRPWPGWTRGVLEVRLGCGVPGCFFDARSRDALCRFLV